MNTGLRIVLELRGKEFWWSFTQGGMQYEGSRGHPTPAEALEEAELHQRLLRLAKWRNQERARRLAENQ